MAILIVFLCFIACNGYLGVGIGDPFREGKLALFWYAFALLGGYEIYKKYNIFIGALWIWSLCLCNYFMWGALDSSSSVLQMMAPVMGIPNLNLDKIHQMLGMFFLPGPGMTIFTVFAFLYLADKCTERLNWLLASFRVTLWIQFVFCASQVLYNPIMFVPIARYAGIPMGTIGHATLVGAFFSAMAPIAWYRWSKIEFIAILIFSYLCDSSMTYASILAAFLTALWCEGYRKLSAMIGIIGIVALAIIWKIMPMLEILNSNGRFKLWLHSLPYMMQRPFTGFGPGAWWAYYPIWKVPNPVLGLWDKMHNEFWQLSFELGLIGLFLAILGIVYTVRKGSKVELCMLAALLTNALANFTFHVPVTGFILCCVLSIISKGLTLEAVEKRSLTFKEMVRFLNPFDDGGKRDRAILVDSAKDKLSRKVIDISNHLRAMIEKIKFNY